MKTIQRKDFIEVGSIVKVHGNKGELKFKLSRDFKLKEWAFLEFRGKPVPFYIEHTKAEFGDEVVMKLREIDSVDKAGTFIGRTLLLPKKLVEKESLVDEWGIEGYLAKDINFGDLGTIEEILEYPFQSLAKVNFNTRELLIPLVDEIILEINDKKKTLLVKLPEGLLEINN